MARLVKLAAPEAPVVAVRVPPGVAPEGPEASAAVTTIPDCATGFPDASRSWSTGCCANAAPLVALADGWVVMVSWDAPPAPIVMPLDTAAVSPEAVKRSVYVPAGPVMARSVKLAAPDALVVAVSVPPSVAPEGPDASAAVTTIPDCANAAPLVALAEGCVVMASWDAAPAPSVTPLDTAAVSPEAVKRSVYVPAGPVMGRAVKLAAPDALVVAVSVPPSVAPEGPD